MKTVRRLRALAGAAAMLAACLSAQGAQATTLCLEPPDPAIEELSRRVGQHPHAALEEAGRRLAQGAALPAGTRAWLHAIRAAAYWELSYGSKTQEEAAAGLALAPDPRSAAHVQLLIYHGHADFHAEAIESAIPRFEAARRLHARGSAENLCLQIALGDAQLKVDRIAEAVANLQEAYLVSREPGHERQRVHAAMALSRFMRYAGDYEQALALLREKIGWDTLHGHTYMLSADHYFEGRFNRLAGRSAESVRHYDHARRLSAPFGDTLGDAYVDLERCMALTDLGRLGEAARLCREAQRVFAAHGEEAEAEARIQLAEVALKQDEPARALELLDGVFGTPAMDSTAISTVHAYLYRAMANARLGNFRQAYEDLAEHQRLFEKRYELERVRLMAAQRAQLEIYRQIEKNEALSKELETAQEHQRQQDQKQFLMLAVAALLIGGLLAGIIVSRRHHRELQDVARKDVLTGLNNRRRTVELVKAVFLEAAVVGTETAVAIIDLDHFKQINDTWGHAAGDAVLIAFAQLLQKTVRPGDIVGRWGGEEFLVVLPETGVDEAVAVLEQARRVLAARRFSFSTELHVSFSAGLATGHAPQESFRILLDRADQALYRAKAEGRDRICIFRKEEDAGSAPADTQPASNAPAAGLAAG